MIIDISTKIGTTSNQGGFKGLLDVYSGAAAAYSLRKLSKATTSVVRVRRDSDNAEADFTALEITDGTLAAFCTGTDGLVTTWYDQSGNGNDATQSTASAQPKIVSAGVLVTDNGKAALQLTESSLETNLSLTQNQIHYLFSVLKTNDSAGIQYWSHNTNNQWVFILEQGSSSIVVSDRFSINSIDKNGVSQSLSTRNDWYNAFGDNNKHLSVLVGKASLSNWNSLGFFGYTGLRLSGFSQEIIIWDSDQSANRSGIEANINKAFNIYWDGTQKGLLDTYTGAEAAYSLRALNSAYTGAILKVRRASDNAEQDIYAKWDGTLNVEALETFCAGTDGYVVTWYDQSGNANNATQATAASQPQIVSSGSIITDSGYQVIKYDGTDDNLTTSLTATGTMLMGGSDGSAFYEVAISGSYSLLSSANNTDHPLNESIRVIWSSSLTTAQKTAIETAVSYTDWDFSDVTSFFRYWRSRSELTDFPLIDTSSGTNFRDAWFSCSSLTSFPALDLSSGTDFLATWRGCLSLTSFPALDVSSGTNFYAAWLDCTSLQDFPANMFDSVTATDFNFAFTSTNLTETSIDNILTSIDTANTSNGTFGQTGGSAPSAVGEAAIDNLRARGWTVTVTGGY